MAQLVLVRHGQSEWNAKGLWTGLMDIPLSSKGTEEAINTGRILSELKFDVAFTSALSRAKKTLELILKELKQSNIPIFSSAALNERDYGIYTGSNKWEVESKIGKDEFEKLRRSWEYPIKDGETLKEVGDRVFKYYKSTVLPHIHNDQSVLISAHGNSIRALIKYLENIPDKDVDKIIVTTGEADIYKMDTSGNILGKEKKAVNVTKA